MKRGAIGALALAAALTAALFSLETRAQVGYPANGYPLAAFYFQSWIGNGLYSRTGMSEKNYARTLVQLAKAADGRAWFIGVVDQTPQSPLTDWSGAKAYVARLRAACGAACGEDTFLIGGMDFSGDAKSEIGKYFDTLHLDGVLVRGAESAWMRAPGAFARVMQWGAEAYPSKVFILDASGFDCAAKRPVIPAYGRNVYLDLSPAADDPDFAFPDCAYQAAASAYPGHILIHFDSSPGGAMTLFGNLPNIMQLAILQNYYNAQPGKNIRFELPVFGGDVREDCLRKTYLYNSQAFGTAPQHTYRNIINLVRIGGIGASFGSAPCEK